MPVAADDNTGGLSAPANGSTSSGDNTAATGGQGQKFERFKEAMAALDLTDAQKEQIKQIRANTTPGKERRQEIMAVLTPDQKAKLFAMIKEHRNGGQSGAATTSTTADN
jgi:Spy/CpxP family protein refolding chaperone